ncbi:hypothetical protein BDF14DRAFT_1875933 [Spinellus fusiger]|nr:hypothetical protein BDF14DRAFT_1875933 [Spinellus fusiger]
MGSFAVPTSASGALKTKRKRSVSEADKDEQPLSRATPDKDTPDTAPGHSKASSFKRLRPTTESESEEEETKEDTLAKLPAGIEELYGFRINPPPLERPVRIYCDGIYDLFHFGHSKALEQAKKAFPNVCLLVGVCSDKETHKRKGKTVMTDTERYEAVRHCKWVDEVITDAPWIIDQEFLDVHRIDYVAHDAEPYQSRESGDVYAFVKDQGRFLPTQRTEGISTSDLITRIVRDYDAYLRRNLERGVSAKELNISFLKERKIKTKKSIEDFRDHIKTALHDTMTVWEEKRHEFIRGFGSMFGAEDVVDKLWKLRTKRGQYALDSASSSRNHSRAPSEEREKEDTDNEMQVSSKCE